ncbi:hypothetical protein VNI00_019328 [Paramarasmius palmivorus]|uniref:Uncharacterized protein n=1 Tax=Paramarasmius palmivorus TaxID=297713 RepID=A0AAW0AMP0_9AGAR
MAPSKSGALQLVLIYGSSSPEPELSNDNSAGNVSDTSNAHDFEPDSDNGNERVSGNDDDLEGRSDDDIEVSSIHSQDNWSDEVEMVGFRMKSDRRIRKPTHFKHYARQFRRADAPGNPGVSSSNNKAVVSAGPSRELANATRDVVDLDRRNDTNFAVRDTYSSATLASTVTPKVTRKGSSEVEEITKGQWKKSYRKAGKRVADARNVAAGTKRVKLGEQHLNMYEIVADSEDDNDTFLT